MQQLIIKTPRLIIRNLTPSDVEAFHAYRSNADVVKYQGFEVMTLDDSIRFISEHKDKTFGQPGEWVQYAIELSSSHILIGDCAIKINFTDNTQAEVGITISPLHQKKGFATEAFKGILSFLFVEQKIRRVVGIVDAENLAAVKLLQHCGFRLEGHFVENIWFKGKWGSEIQYAMLKREWEEKK